MKNIKCYKCGAIFAVPDDTMETVCKVCGAQLRLAPPSPAPVQAPAFSPAPTPAPAPMPVAPGAAPAPRAYSPAAASLFDPNIPSYFDGKLGQYIGLSIVCFLQALFTLGIGIPWVIIKKKKWVFKHTIIRGQRLKLTARGSQLIGNYIKWFLLTCITFGIYGLWVPIKYQQWYASHLEFDGDPLPPYELPKKVQQQMQKEKEKEARRAQKEMEKAAKK